MQDFKKLLIWENAIQITKDVYTYCHHLPTQERFNLINQLQRASVSIPSNIAEGCGKSSPKEFRKFLEISLGSAYETETLLLLSKEIYPLVPDNSKLTSELRMLEKQILALRAKVLKTIG